MVNSINTLNFNYLQLKKKLTEKVCKQPQRRLSRTLYRPGPGILAPWYATVPDTESRSELNRFLSEPAPKLWPIDGWVQMSDMRHGRAPPPSDSAGHTVLSLPVAAVHPGAGTVTPAEAPAHRPARWRDTLISGRPWPVTCRWTEWDCVLILYYFEAQPPIFDTFQDKKKPTRVSYRSR